MLFRTQLVEINAFKLLNREIYLSRLDIDGCTVLLSGDQDNGDGFLPLSFMSQEDGDDEYEALKAPLTGWEITSIPIHLKNGSIIYTEKEKAKGAKKHSIENIHTKASIARDNLVISSFGLSYRDAVITLSGSVQNFFKKDPVSNLQIQGEVPSATVKEFFPEQLASVENEVRCKMLLNVRGPISQLDIDSELNLRAAAETPHSLYIPADILLKAHVQDTEDFEVEYLKISAPLGTLSMKGTVKHFLTEGRQFHITHTAAVKLNELVRQSNNSMTVEGVLPISGVIEGECGII